MSALKTSVVVEENLNENGSGGSAAEGDTSGSDISNDEEDTEKKSGWADSIARVLAEEKPRNKSSVILSRAKKPSQNSKKKLSFEIEGEIKEVEKKPSNEELEAEAARQKAERLERKRKREALRNLSVRPDITERSREIALKRVATRGVVQLFNAVQAQQKDITKRLETEKLEHKKEKVLKNVNKTAFLDALMGGPRAKSELIDNPVKDEDESEEESNRPSTWNVLKDDFMLPSKKNKDWDKMDEDDEENDQRSEPENEDSNKEESD
ncbi:RRP15-like protein isoform X2 [Phlebotomus papatasi]|uniref:RRP15-like protein isoform X2 n=1 Tax=Phlebotomus papatasi TaxID=29031 RepID=UPI002483CC27|nr:RRP15-like protein isoform X2 [Phlebotomus papatasi]